MYHNNKSQLLKIFDPTSFFTSALKKDALTLDFSAIVNSQVAVTTSKTFSEIADGIIKFFQNISSGYSHIEVYVRLIHVKLMVVDNFFPFIEATNIPKDFQGNFLRHNRIKVV